MDNENKTTVNFKIDTQLWEKFKSVTPSNITLSQAIINLIKEKIEHGIKKN